MEEERDRGVGDNEGTREFIGEMLILEEYLKRKNRHITLHH